MYFWCTSLVRENKNYSLFVWDSVMLFIYLASTFSLSNFCCCLCKNRKQMKSRKRLPNAVLDSLEVLHNILFISILFDLSFIFSSICFFLQDLSPVYHLFGVVKATIPAICFADVYFVTTTIDICVSVSFSFFSFFIFWDPSVQYFVY